jgi:hypothetical protein
MATCSPVHSGLAADVHSTWVGPMYGSWQEATNWIHTPALPGADYPHNDLLTYDVEITNGNVVVAPSLSFSIESLTLNEGTLHRTTHRSPSMVSFCGRREISQSRG